MPDISGKQGSVLISVLVIMLVVTILGLTLISISMSDMLHAARQETNTKAYYIARSGADAVAAHLIQNPADIPLFISYGEQEAELGKGSFVVAVREEADGTIIIESVGSVGSSEKKVTLTLVSAGPVLDMAVFALSSMRMTNHVAIHGNAGTNSSAPNSVRLSNHVQVDGNFYTGLGSNPYNVISPPGGVGHITGDVGNLDEEAQYPMPDFPDFPTGLWPEPDISLWGHLIHTIDADAQYSSISLSNFSHLYIDVGDDERHILVDNFAASNDSKITILGSGKLNLYVTNQFHMSNFVTFNDEGDSGQVTLYYKGNGQFAPSNDTRFYGTLYSYSANIKLSNFSNIIGNIISGGNMIEMSNHTQVDNPTTPGGQVIYAPTAEVKLTNHATVFGSIVCNRFDATNDAQVYFEQPDSGVPIPGAKGLKRGLWR